PYTTLFRSVHKGGFDLSARTRPLDGGRALHNSFLSGDGAAGEAGVVCGVIFLGRWWRLVLADLSRRRPVYARRRDTACQGRTPPRQNRQSGPEIRGVRRGGE